MRSTCGNAKWIFDGQGALIGVSLGGDATTEHECGTRPLAASFGYEYGAAAGVMARKVTKLPNTYGVQTVVNDGEECLLLSSSLESAARHVGSELRFWSYSEEEPANTAAAWDQGNFAILCRGPDMAKLQQLADAFARLDIMAGGLLGKRYTGVNGLVYAVASQVPQDLIDEVQADLDEEVTRANMLNNSGVKDRLRAAGRSWFSLDKTIWADEGKTSIRVWLNPMEQQKYSYGWFTIEELEEWVHDRGRVVLAAK